MEAEVVVKEVEKAVEKEAEADMEPLNLPDTEHLKDLRAQAMVLQ